MPAMFGIRWVKLTEPEADREYIVLLTYLPLKRFRSLQRFRRFVRDIEADLRASPGIFAYAIWRRRLRRQFWTLSVWEDDTSLMNFVYRVPNHEAIDELKDQLRDFKRARWTAPAADIPVRWKQAIAKLHD